MAAPPSPADTGPLPAAGPDAPQATDSGPADGTCQPMLMLVGQPESILPSMDFVEGTRIYRTGDPVTMDFRPDRMNIEIGPDGSIVKVSCG